MTTTGKGLKYILVMMLVQQGGFFSNYITPAAPLTSDYTKSVLIRNPSGICVIFKKLLVELFNLRNGQFCIQIFKKCP